MVKTAVCNLRVPCRDLDGNVYVHTVTIDSEGNVTTPEHYSEEWAQSARVIEALGGDLDASTCARLMRLPSNAYSVLSAEDFDTLAIERTAEWTEGSWKVAHETIAGLTLEWQRKDGLSYDEEGKDEHFTRIDPSDILPFLKAAKWAAHAHQSRVESLFSPLLDRPPLGIVGILVEGVPLSEYRDWLDTALSPFDATDLCLRFRITSKRREKPFLELHQANELADIYEEVNTLKTETRRLGVMGAFPMDYRRATFDSAMEAYRVCDPSYPADRLLAVLRQYPHAGWGPFATGEKMRHMILQMDAMRPQRIRETVIETCQDTGEQPSIQDFHHAACDITGMELSATVVAEALHVIPSALSHKYVGRLTGRLVELLETGTTVMEWDPNWCWPGEVPYGGVG